MCETSDVVARTIILPLKIVSVLDYKTCIAHQLVSFILRCLPSLGASAFREVFAEQTQRTKGMLVARVTDLWKCSG